MSNSINVYKRPFVLTIAGFDPSAGAGVLADIKTFEQHRLMGLAVQTANTTQTEDVFGQVCFTDEQIVLDQLALLLKQYQPKAIKFGLVPSVQFIEKCLKLIGELAEPVFLLWDPVLSASAGSAFQVDVTGLNKLLPKLDLITPNTGEFELLELDVDNVPCDVLLTGGHNQVQKGKDILYTPDGKQYPFNALNKKQAFEKHGSGCVFSAAIVSNIALGHHKIKAVLKSKRYVERYLTGNSQLLGYHRF